MLRKAQAPRPFSRLDNVIESKPAKNFTVGAGIPEKNRSASKAFPGFIDEDDTK